MQLIAMLALFLAMVIALHRVGEKRAPVRVPARRRAQR